MSQPHRQHSNQPIQANHPTLKRLRRLSHLLDNAIPIPGTSYRIGIDPLIGLLPGGGDFVGSILSAYIVVEAARMGVPRKILVQMVSNIVLDTVSGTVPVLGDLVDVAFKANSKNVAILEEHLNVPRQQLGRKVDWLFLAMLLVGLFLFVILMAAISVMLIGWIWRAITG